MKERRKLFWSEYAECGEGITAALRAGYSRKYAAAVAAKLLADREEEAEPSARAEADEAADGAVTVDWVVREARRTYDAAHEAGSLSTAVSCLNLIGRHLEARGGSVGEESGVVVVTGIEGAPGSDADD